MSPATSQPAFAPRVQRFDAGVLRPSHTTDEGFIVCEAFVARPGVYEYIQPDGQVIRELILPEELHRADSLGTLALKSVTLEHPPEDVTPDNYERHAAGDVGAEVSVVEGGYVKVILTAKRRDAIAALQGGIQETSPGYTCRIEPTSGEHPEYGRYDRIQRDRRYNHLAITKRARGGPTIHARVDGAVVTAPVRGAYQRRTDALFADLPPAGGSTAEPRSQDMAITDEDIQRIAAALQGRGPSRQDGDDKYDALAKKVDKLAEQMDAFMKSSKKDEDGEEDEEGEDGASKKDSAGAPDFKTYYHQRRRLEQLAQAHRLDAEEVEGMENAELAKAIVLEANPKARKDAEPRYYLDALDFLEQPASERQDSGAPGGAGASPNPYQTLGEFSASFEGEGQRQDSGGEDPLPSVAALENLNRQFHKRHAS